MTIKQAIEIMKSDTADFHEIRAAIRVLSEAGYCPNCLKKSLGEFQEGDYYHNAGRECRECEEFVICGPQPEYANTPDCRSDADPGL